MSQAIFDPGATIQAQLADSVSKGFLSAADADKIIAADAWANANRERLQAEFPGRAVTVVPDDSVGAGFSTYVGDSSYESENKARQFSPGVPYVTLEPRSLFGPVAMFDVADDLLGWIRRQAEKAQLAEFGALLEEQEKKGDAAAEATKKLIELLEKMRKDGQLPDDKIIEMFGPILDHNSCWVGGYISDAAGHENIKLWLIDTGASVSSISKENFERLQKKGAQPKQEGEVELMSAEGVKKYPKYSGIPMSFVRKDKNGKSEIAKCDVPVVVSTSDLLGMDQLKKTGTKLIIDPAGGTVELVARS